MSTLLLPDTSEFQSGPSAPDWAGIKKQNGGAAIIRVGYGADHLDHMFVSNYTALKKNKFSFSGLYHYLRQDQDTASQAAAFCTWVGPPSAVAPGTVFILDLEEGTGNQWSRANAWLSHIDNFYRLTSQPLNMRSWLYSYVSFANDTGLTPVFASPRRTWIASYSSTEPSLGHTLWQSTDGTKGSHITNWAGCGRIDTSIYHGTLPQLAALGWEPPMPPPADRQFHGEYVTAGMFSLADIAGKLGYPVNTLLRMTAVHYGTFGDDLGQWISDVLTGAKPWNTPVPGGAKLWCD